MLENLLVKFKFFRDLFCRTCALHKNERTEAKRDEDSYDNNDLFHDIHLMSLLNLAKALNLRKIG